MKSGAGLSVSRSLVFKVKRLLDDGWDLMSRPRGRKKGCEWND
jgi:hypothetical protein